MPTPPEHPPSERVLRRRREIGERFRQARLRANLTQEKLSERAGVSRDSIIRVEAGSRSAQLDWLILMADAIGAPLDHLMREPPRGSSLLK